jgi:uncharacterized protein YxjI
MSDALEYDRFLIEQLVRPVVNLYQITPLGPAETPLDGPVAFVRQKRMALKEDIRFFRDESEAEELFRIKARSLIDVGGRYDVTDATEARIGVLEHQFGRSLVRSTWRILDAAEQEVAVARERSPALAVARRIVDFIPYGELVPIPYNFDLELDGRKIGSFDRKFQLRDRYVLDLSGDAERRIDRRLAIALGIALDALQNR